VGAKRPKVARLYETDKPARHRSRVYGWRDARAVFKWWRSHGNFGGLALPWLISRLGTGGKAELDDVLELAAPSQGGPLLADPERPPCLAEQGACRRHEVVFDSGRSASGPSEADYGRPETLVRAVMQSARTTWTHTISLI